MSSSKSKTNTHEFVHVYLRKATGNHKFLLSEEGVDEYSPFFDANIYVDGIICSICRMRKYKKNKIDETIVSQELATLELSSSQSSLKIRVLK